MVTGGKKIPENSSIGIIASWMYSKSCHERMKVVSAKPTALVARLISSVAGSARSSHHDCASPRNAIASRKTAE